MFDECMRLATLFVLLLFAGLARAEWFGDLYGGGSYTPRSDVTMVIGSQNGPADHVFHDLRWDPSLEYGVRGGYWFESAPRFGLGLDLFHFDADLPIQDVRLTFPGVDETTRFQAVDFRIVALGLDARFRYPLLASSEYPRGRLQPYLTAGPALFRVTVTNRGNGELTTEPATDTALGYKLGGGLSWQLTKATAIFGEYRYTHFHAEPELHGTITGARVPTQFDLNTHHVIAGVSFAF